MMENSIERKVFDEWFNNKYVWCNTLEKAQTFLSYADNIGYRWFGGNSLLKENYWFVFKKKTYYFVGSNGISYNEIKNKKDYIKLTNWKWEKFLKEVKNRKKIVNSLEYYKKQHLERQGSLESLTLKVTPDMLKIYDLGYNERLRKYEVPKVDDMSSAFFSGKVKVTTKLNKTIPIYIGYKGRKTTLVWSDNTTTTATANEKEKKVDYDFGFLMAYYKRVQLQTNQTPEQTQKWIENNVYGLPQSQRKAYLLAIFDEYCGLSIRKRNAFLEKYLIKKTENEQKITLKVSEKYL